MILDKKTEFKMEIDECNSYRYGNTHAAEESKNNPAEGDASAQNTACLKTLTEGHSAVQANLQQATADLSAKQAYHKELEEDLARQKEKNCFLDERVNSMSEKICCYQRALERKEKRQEEVVAELVDVKWKIQEAKELMEKLKTRRVEFEGKAGVHKERISKLENLESSVNPHRQQIEENIKRLQAIKTGLESGDTQLCAIRSGSKMMELEQKKRAIREAFNERSVRLEMLLVDADEKTESVEKLKQQLKQSEERYKSQLHQVKSQLQYTLETKRRLERSVEYMQAKIDYGIRVPAPPPWTSIKYVPRKP